MHPLSRLACSVMLAAASSSHAQILPGGSRPGEQALPAPEFQEEAPEPRFELPPLPAPPEGRLSSAPTLTVDRFVVTGSTVFTPEQIDAVTERYLGRPVTSEDLQRLRNELTLLYVDQGYVNSGAVLPDQQVQDGVVRYQIVEGRLSGVEIEGQRFFRESYFTSRIERGAGGRPLDVRGLEQELQILQQDPRIRRVQAELRPGSRAGEGLLKLRVDERFPLRLRFETNNYESPSINAYRSGGLIGWDNLTGRGDKIELDLGFTEGLDDYEMRYELPVRADDTIVGIRYRYSKSDVVEEPFESLDIGSRSRTAGVSVRRPFRRSLRTSLWLSLTGEWRESETFLDGSPFPFTPGTDDGKTTVSVVRFAADWTYRDRSQVFAARLTASLGLDLLGATVNGGDIPDSQFLTWLGQFQWARRFDPWGVEALFRSDVQLTSSPLPSLEQFSMGGHSTVRGYRENQLVRDQGAVASLELRIPLLRDSVGIPLLQLAPFADIGRSWNRRRSERSPRTLYSAGVGLRFRLTEHLEGNVYWGEQLRDIHPHPRDDDLQDEGVQFRLVLRN